MQELDTSTVKPDSLADVYLLQELTPEQLATFLGASRLVSCDAQEVIIREGDAGDEMYILLEGEVQVSRKLTMLADMERDEMAKTLVTLSGKERPFFGEMGVLGQKERTASVIARKDCRLLTIHQRDFEALCARDPKMGVSILRRIALTAGERLLKTNKDVMKLTTALCLALED
jgi:CRP/FNR family cyclic AMP-dependent transcriptional regulator